MGEWIKCSDSMPCGPDESRWVLVYADEAINCMAYTRGRWEDWTGATMHNIRTDDITHWMPLPEPPK